MASRKKYFTLIHGDNVHQAPKSKVIPAKEFSELLDGVDLLKKVKKDADEYVQKVTEEAEQIKEKAQREGFEEGFRKWAEQLSFLEEEVHAVRKEVEKVIIPVALSAAKKIFGREVRMSEDAIVDIVRSNLKAVAQHKKVKILVNSQDRKAIEKKKSKLKELFEGLESLTVQVRDDVERGGCVIETEGGIINAQLENQWQILERAFEKALIKEKQELATSKTEK